jgi:hypothetical protein
MIKYNLKIQRVKIIAPRKIGQRVSIQTKQSAKAKATHVRTQPERSDGGKC